MKKISYLIPLALTIASCSDAPVADMAENEEPDVRAAEIAVASITDLSADEMANCYIVRSPGIYMFKADNRFNLGEELPVPPEIKPAGAKLIWQTVRGSVSSVELIEDNLELYIKFEVSKAEGNAIIAAVDESGETVWSWHIWMPEEDIAGIKTATGYEVMNMNLGAMNNTPGDASSYGMLYQWGRKDPFPAAATLTGTTSTLSAPMYDIEGNQVYAGYSSWYSDADNTLEYSIAHPMVCLSNYSHYVSSRDWLAVGDDSLWGEVKTCYDPSPAGWRVAPADAFSNLTTSGGYAWDFEDFNVADINGDGVKDINDYNYGWHFLVSENTPLYFPAAARFDGSYAMLMGSMSGLWGNYWSCSPFRSSVNEGVEGMAFCCLSFMVKGQNGEDWITVSPSGGASKADAYSVRCVRDGAKGQDSGVKVVRPD